jgi:hypothetical protein
MAIDVIGRAANALILGLGRAIPNASIVASDLGRIPGEDTIGVRWRVVLGFPFPSLTRGG